MDPTISSGKLCFLLIGMLHYTNGREHHGPGAAHDQSLEFGSPDHCNACDVPMDDARFISMAQDCSHFGDFI